MSDKYIATGWYQGSIRFISRWNSSLQGLMTNNIWIVCNSKRMKVLVTGHKGFIGSHVFDFLSDIFDVDGLDRPDDIENFVDVGCADYDLIIHLAAYAALRDSVDNPDKFWENNVEKSKPIFDYCRKYNTRLLYASSAGAYSWWQNPYAITKKVNEIQAPPNSVGMRFFNVWAEEGSRDDMLYEMLKQGTAKYITRHKRDWVHVLDVVRADCNFDSQFIYRNNRCRNRTDDFRDRSCQCHGYGSSSYQGGHT